MCFDRFFFFFSFCSSCFFAVSTFGNEGGGEALRAGLGRADGEEEERAAGLLGLASALARAGAAGLAQCRTAEAARAALRLLRGAETENTAARAAQLLALLCADAATARELEQSDMMEALLARPDGLAPLLPRLLRHDALARQFVLLGGVSLLSRVVVFEQNTQHELASCVAAVELLGRDPVAVATMVQEEGFVRGTKNKGRVFVSQKEKHLSRSKASSVSWAQMLT
jgi:hypothetical protein